MSHDNNQKRPPLFTRSTLGKVDSVTIQEKQVLVQMPDLSTRRVMSTGKRSSTKIEVELQPDLAHDRAGKRGPDGKLLPMCYKVSLETPVRIYPIPTRREPKQVETPAPIVFEPIESSQTNQESGQDDEEMPFVPATIISKPAAG